MNKILSILLVTSLWLFSLSAEATTRTYNILDFGASHDTTVVHTDAINKAIETCSRDGGGKVIIPSGKYMSGTIFMKDNVDLYFENGAYLFASDNYDHFPIQPKAAYRSLKDAGGWSALIFAEKARNISISGNGIIDGRGKGRKGRVQGVAGDCNGRPRNILFISCKDVKISDISMYNSALWNQHYLDCEDVIVTNIKVYNHANGNNDGIDIDGCRRFILSNSIIDSDDDGIVLKSTGVAPCENIIINNCIVSSFANAIKCGTESTGGFKNILISDCIIKPSSHKGQRILKSTPSGITAISLEIVDGGIMDGVSVNNILIEGTECPLYVRLANRARKHIEETEIPAVGKMRNIQISNIIAYNTGNFCSSITGIPGAKIENLYLNNIRFVNKGGLEKGSFRDMKEKEQKRHDVGVDMYFDKYLASFKDVAEDDKGYPQPTVWRNLPSYGLFIRHVESIEVDNATFSSNGTEPRPAIVAVNVDNLCLNKIKTNNSTDTDIIVSEVMEMNIDEKLKVKTEK